MFITMYEKKLKWQRSTTQEIFKEITPPALSDSVKRREKFLNRLLEVDLTCLKNKFP